MTYYAHIMDGVINGCGQCRVLSESALNVVISEEVYNNIDMYIYSGGEVILNPNYEEEQLQKEKERIGTLTCTKRVFALMLQELGISYSQLKELIATNEQAQLEWDLSIQLLRGNPLLDIMAGQLNITPEQLDGLFKYANEEITIEQFRELIPETAVDNSELDDGENLSSDVVEEK